VTGLLIIIFGDVGVYLHFRNFFVAVQRPLRVGRARDVGRMCLVGLSLEHNSLLLYLTSCLQFDPTVVKVNDVRRHLDPIVPTPLATILLKRLVGGAHYLRVGRKMGGVSIGITPSRLERVLLFHLFLHQIRALSLHPITIL
jgi:hypothetical protein